jgi:acyl-CoA synthetase (AMP-forming)/AMP-acid ligase II/thioesterase domain-containing protein
MQRSVVERIVSQAFSSNGDSVAVYDGATRLTYRELISWATALSEEIDALPDPEIPIGILLPSAANYLVAVLALLMARRTAVPMDESHPLDRNRLIIDRAGSRAIIVNPGSAPGQVMPNLLQISVSCAPVVRAIMARIDSYPDYIFAINFTSGSTGQPKGVCKLESSLIHRFNASLLPPNVTDRIAIVQSISGSSATNIALHALSVGAQVGIFELKRLGLGATRRLLDEFRPTAYDMVSSIFRTLFRSDDSNAANLTGDARLVRLGAERVRHSDVDLYRRCFPRTCRLVVMIGANETSSYASWCIDHETPLDSTSVPVGYPVTGVELELIGENGEAVRTSEIGEIFVTGPTVAAGYWRDEVLTNARFSPSPKFPGMTRYRTGDFGRLLPNGLLEFIDRRDRQVKIRGNTVHLSEIEAVLALCPRVAELSIVARQCADEIVLVAYCTPAVGSVLLEDQLRQWCRERLPAPMRPTHFFVTDTLPKLPNGKLDLIKLEALDKRRNVTEDPKEAATLSHLSGVVRKAWTGVLHAESFDADMAFDAAGGDSLKGLELMVHLEALLGHPIAIGTLTLETRPSELIQRLSQTAERDPAADDTRPFIVLFTGWGGNNVNISEFYRLLSKRFRVMAIHIRLGGDALVGEFDADRYFAAAISEIHRTGPHRRLWLMGYSFGGRLAAETARLLLASGTAVEAVINLDGPRGGSLELFPAGQPNRSKGFRVRLRSGLAANGGVGRYLLNLVAVRVAPFAVRHRAYWMLRPLLALVRRRGSALSQILLFRAGMELNPQGRFGDLPAGALHTALWLFVTDDDPDRPDRGWGGWCEELHKISVGGTHLTMLSPPTVGVVVNELAKLEVALRGK